MSLSLLEIEANNPAGPRRGRYFCPICQPGGGKTPDLSVDIERGLYHCFKCEIGGKLVESLRTPSEWSEKMRELRPRFPRRRRPRPVPSREVRRARHDFPGSPADAYERARGIDGARTGMGFDARYPFPREDDWVEEPAVVFFFFDLAGRCVAKQGRMLRQPDEGQTGKVTFGKISLGVFHPEALQAAEVVICEGPNSAAALVQRGYAALALGGKIAHDWLFTALQGKRVTVGFDQDDPGRTAAAALVVRLSDAGIQAQAIHPPDEGTDWNDLLLREPGFEVGGRALRR